jgi:hypothetical protein
LCVTVAPVCAAALTAARRRCSRGPAFAAENSQSDFRSSGRFAPLKNKVCKNVFACHLSRTRPRPCAPSPERSRDRPTGAVNCCVF